jgi:hypothetical protein
VKLTVSPRIAGGAVIAGLVLGTALLAPSAALATKPAPDHQVTICHRTNSDTNPYVEITVDIASSGHLKGGHDTEHEGPIWNPTLKTQKIEWGDIIPPYTYLDFSYPGQNIGPEGQAILDNGCVVPGQPVEPEETPSEDAPTPSGAVEAETGVPDPTPPATDSIADASARTSDASLLFLFLATVGVAAALGADRARARARR